MSRHKGKRKQARSAVVIAGGGTGGHIYPGVALAEALQENGYEVVWMGSGSALEKRILKPYSFRYEFLEASPYRGTSLKQKLCLPFKLFIGVVNAVRKLIKIRPRYIITMGGYVSVTTGCAAKLLGVPIYVCEQNAKSGLANRWLANIADAIFTAYPDVFSGVAGRKVFEFGNPLRHALVEASQGGKRVLKDELRILILGGSQGAQALNQWIPRELHGVKAEKPIRVIHQAGRGAVVADIKKAYEQSGIDAEVEVYFENMEVIYRGVDVVIARSGALTLSELVQFGVPAILVPLPGSADNHQLYNALYHEKRGACWILPQEELKKNGKLAKMVSILAGNGQVLRNMQVACSRLRRDDVAGKIIEICEERAQGNGEVV